MNDLEQITARLLAADGNDRLTAELEASHTAVTAALVDHLCMQVREHAYRNAADAADYAHLAVQAAQKLGDPSLLGRAWLMQGNIHLLRNQYQNALTDFEQAAVHYRAAGQTEYLVSLKINQVNALCQLGRYPQALELAEAIHRDHLQGNDDTRSHEATLAMTEGWIHKAMGNREAALTTYMRAREIMAEDERQATQVALIDMSRADLLVNSDPDLAADLLHDAYRTLIAVEHYQEAARAEWNLGLMAYRHGRYQRALHYLERARRTFADIPLPAEVDNIDLHRLFIYDQLNLITEALDLAEEITGRFQARDMLREYAQCLMVLGAIHQRLGLLTEAHAYYKDAVPLLRKNKAHRPLAELTLRRAELALEMGDKKVANRLAKGILLAHMPIAVQTQAELLLARVYLQHKNPQEYYIRSHLSRAEERLRTHYLPALWPDWRAAHGRLAEQTGQWEAAFDYYRTAVDEHSRLQQLMSIDELQLNFQAGRLHIYQAAVRLAQRLVMQDKLSPERLLTLLNQAQTAPLLNRSAAHGADNAETEELAAQRRRWHQQQTAYAEAQTAAERRERQADLQHTEQIIADLSRRARTMHAGDDVLSGETEEAAVFSAAAVQAALAPDECILQYYETDGQIHLVCITAVAIDVHAYLIDTNLLNRYLRAWQFYLRRQYAGPAPTAEAANTHLNRFYNALLAPAALTAETQTIFVVLPAILHNLPFAALYDGQTYLTEKAAVVYLSAASAVLAAKRPSEASEEQPRAAVFSAAADRLAHTVTETSHIAAALQDGWQTAVYLDAEANRQAFTTAATEAQLLHIASHAEFRADNPLFSWFELADTRITVLDLYTLALPQRPFVVLSACETGRGVPRGGGLIGMGRGFLAAGAQGLLVTLWRVEDTATSRLMADFYGGRASRPSDYRSFARSLQAAQNAAIQADRPPFFWAGWAYFSG